ncbi:MAG: TVP38/TMEM64 family protein [Acutalibacteraceae bacterium]
MKKIDEKTVLTLRRVACLAVLAGFIGVSVFLYVRYGKQLWNMLSDVDKFKNWIDGFGAWSGIVFVAVRTFQTVVKIIPAEPLEIGSGLVFGAVGGMLLCLLGSMIGTVFILLLTRKLGTRVLELFHLDDKLQSMKFLQNKEKRNALLFLFYVLPGTPKDVMAYFVGLTDMNLAEYMIISGIARIPSIISSTICGAFLGQKNLPLAIGVFAATTVLSILGGISYKKIAARYAGRRSKR